MNRHRDDEYFALLNTLRYIYKVFEKQTHQYNEGAYET